VADAPWRCSQCGTVNEPVANACRTCGRWPSLFDLEQETIDVDRPDPVEDDPYAAQSVDVGEEIEPEAFEVDPAPSSDEVDMPPEFEEKPDEYEAPKPPWRRLARFIVPIAFVVYLLVRSAVGSN
jgi:hypothetical protein